MSKRGYSLTSKETAAVSVAVGFGVAAVAGLGLGAALGAGVYSLSTGNKKDKRDSLSHKHVKRDSQGRIENWTQVLKVAQQAGISPEFRAEIWPYLLTVYSPHSTLTDRDTELTKLQRLYTRLVLVCEELDKELDVHKAAVQQYKLEQQKLEQQHAHDVATHGKPGKLHGKKSSLHGGSRRHKRSSSSNNAQTVATGGGKNGSASHLPGVAEAPVMPGNLAAFSEAHRIIVMDALRTDLSTRPDGTTPTTNNGNNNNNSGGTASTSTASNNNKTGRQEAGSSSSASTQQQQRHQPTVTVLPVSTSDGLPELMLIQPPSSSEPPLSPSAAVAAGQLPVWRSELASSTIDGAAHVSFENRELMMRLVNVLSAYSVHDPETGYCQGMSDLAAVFVQLFDDDAVAFACFERFMRHARRNFKHDQSGIRYQLSQIGRIIADTDPTLYSKLQSLQADDCTFAYRMVVVMLRRELPLQQATTLWEVQWAVEAAEAAEREANAFYASALVRKNSTGGAGGPSSGAQQQPSSGTSTTGNNNNATAQLGSGGSSGSFSAAAGLAETIKSMDIAAKEAVGGLASATTTIGSSSGGTTTSNNNNNNNTLTSTKSGGNNSSSGKGGGAGGDREPPPDFLLQFIAAAVRAQRSKVLFECHDTDDVLRLFNTIKIDFWTALAQARKQYKAYAQGLAVLQRLS